MLLSYMLPQTAAWETARLRVRATSMAAENDALKNHVAQLMHQISNMDRSVQVCLSTVGNILKCINGLFTSTVIVSDPGVMCKGGEQ